MKNKLTVVNYFVVINQYNFIKTYLTDQLRSESFFIRIEHIFIYIKLHNDYVTIDDINN